MKYVLFGDFNMRFITEKDPNIKYTTDEINNNKTLKRLIRKGRLIVGNNYEGVENNTCITADEYILSDEKFHVPFTRYDGRGGGSTIDFIMWHRD